MKAEYFSNRIYKNTLDKSTVETISKLLEDFNCAKFTAYSMFVNKEYKKHTFKDSIHMIVKNRFGFNDYYANSAVREANSVFKSNVELKSLQMEQLKDKISHSESKIKELEKQYKNKETVRKSLVKLSKQLKKNGKVSKFKTYNGADEICAKASQEGVLFGVRYKKKSRIYFSIWEFEYGYLVPKMKHILNRIKQIQYGISLRKERVKLLEKQPYFSCFGSKSFFKKQFTFNGYKYNHEKWLQEFKNKRYSSMQISGRKDATQGNFIFRYDIQNKTVIFTTSYGAVIEINKLYFPYGQNNVNNALTVVGANRKAVAWTIEDKGEYYIFKCTIELPKKDLNFSKVDGVVGMDINYDCLAWSNLDKYGNLLNHGVIPFELVGKSTGQAVKIIEEACKKMIEVCEKYKKPLSIEILNTEKSKNFLQYGSKNRNFKFSQFAYRKIIDAIFSRAYKQSVYVYQVNPKFTSQIGKFKYMRRFGLSIHESASIAIGRRGLGLQDKVPLNLFSLVPNTIKLKHNWSHWSYLMKSLKKIPVKCFYEKYATAFEDMTAYLEQLKTDFKLT